MKPPVFDYTAPDSVSQALTFLSDDTREAKVIAGGQSLIPMLNMRLARPELLVDVSKIASLDSLRVDDEGSLHVGAAVPQARVAADSEVRQRWPLLAAAIEHIGHPQIRSRGTLCGSLAHHDPAAELPAVANALGARCIIACADGTREVPAEEFFVSTFQTVVESDELLVEVVFPPCWYDGWSVLELTRREGDFAMVGAVVCLRSNSGSVQSARMVFCGAGSTPIHVSEVESALLGQVPDKAVRTQAQRALQRTLDPPGDVHASAHYRTEAAAVLLDRAVAEAWERCSDR